MSQTLEQQREAILARIAIAKAARRGTRDLQDMLRDITHRILRRDLRNAKRKRAA